MEWISSTDETRGSSRMCYSCGFEMVAYGQFCRFCGALLAAAADLDLPKNTSATLVTNDDDDSSPSYSTTPLAQKAVYQRISKPLIKTLLTSLLVNKANCFENRMVKVLLLALIVLPIWLLIIAISPFDAFLTAKTAVKDG